MFINTSDSMSEVPPASLNMAGKTLRFDEKVSSDAPPPYDEASQKQPPPRSPIPRGPLPLDLPALNAARSKRTILASASPRRKQLLAQVNLSSPILTKASTHAVCCTRSDSQTSKSSHLPSPRTSRRPVYRRSSTSFRQLPPRRWQYTVQSSKLRQ